MLNSEKKNNNDITPYSEEEKPYYDSDSAPAICKENTPKDNNNLNQQQTTNHQQKVFKPKSLNKKYLDKDKKRVIFAFILLFICIIDIILQIVFDFINPLSLSDDIAIFILLIYFFFNYFIRKEKQIKNIFLAILLIITWLGGFVCKFLVIPFFLAYEKSYKYYVKAILIIIYVIFIIVRSFGLMITFRG